MWHPYAAAGDRSEAPMVIGVSFPHLRLSTAPSNYTRSLHGCGNVHAERYSAQYTICSSNQADKVPQAGPAY